MPVIIIQFHMIATIVVARPPRFLAEQCVLSHRLRCEQTVLQFPCPLELVEIFCADVLEIFLHDIQQLNAALEQFIIGHVVDADTAHVFIHHLLKALQALDRQEIAW